jgi:hypothetical protein
VTWAWLLAWNAFWLVWALAYMSLEAKLGKGGGSQQAGRDRRRLEGRPMGRPRHCPVGRLRAHRH